MDGRRVTSVDIAREAGVSQSTVSRCYRPGAYVSPEARQRVEAAARRLGYVPDLAARALITGRTGLLGLLLSDAVMLAYPDLTAGFAAHARAAGRMPLLVSLPGEELGDADCRRLLGNRIDGLVSCLPMTAGQVALCGRQGVPVALYNAGTRPGASSVASDGEAAMRLVAEELARSGARRVLFIGGPPGNGLARQRQRGFRQGFLGPGRRLLAAEGDFGYDSGWAAAESHLAPAGTVDAVVGANDAMAMGAMDFLRFRLGRRIPEEVEVIGFDDTEAAGRRTYDLTTLRQPLDAMCAEAVRILTAEDGAPRRAVFPCELVRRGSGLTGRESPART